MERELSFSQRFGREPQILVRSPGRVNLIGEHTDYNLGFVLPAAIDRYTKLAAAPRSDRKLNVYSETYSEQLEIDLDSSIGLLGETAHWSNYTRGVVWWLKENGHMPQGGDILIWGDLPIGVGLSSSASLLMGLLGTMASLGGYDIPRVEMAQAARSIENDFIGVPTGIMDQMAIGLSQPRSAL